MVRLFSVLLLLGIIGSGTASGETLALNTSDIAPRSTPEGTGFEDLILKEAFARIGIGIRVVRLPSERALINVDQGVDDGNFARVEGVEARYPNVLMVPAKICQFTFTAFTRDPAIRISRWEDLAPYNVAMLNGWQYPERHMPKTRSLHKVRNEEALFGLLDSGRADVVVHELFAGKMFLKSKGLAGITAQEPPLATPDMFLYLNRRHAGLVPELAETLRRMDEDGTLQGIIDRKLKEAGLR